MNRYDAFAHEKVAVDAVTSLTAATYAPAGGIAARRAIITCETDAVRCCWDGSTPAADVGHLFPVSAKINEVLVLEGLNNIRNFKAIKVTLAAVLRATYER